MKRTILVIISICCLICGCSNINNDGTKFVVDGISKNNVPFSEKTNQCVYKIKSNTVSGYICIYDTCGKFATGDTVELIKR